MKLIEWWQQAGARTAWLSSDLRAELSGDTEVSIDALAPDLREIASALLLCQKTDYSHALERLNAHAFTDELNGLASLLKARFYAQAGDFSNAGVELENAKNLSADPRIVAEVALLLSQDLDLADDVLESGGLCESEEWQRALGDTCSFLPRDIQSQIRGQISTVSWLTDGGIVAMLCIVLDMKQREYPSALKLIEETYPQSSSKGHLFLLRARVHHALDEFDEMLLCLKGAAELCDDVDMFQEVFDELSANAMAQFEGKRAESIQKNVPPSADIRIIIPTAQFPVLEIIQSYVTGLRILLESIGLGVNVFNDLEKLPENDPESKKVNIWIGFHVVPASLYRLVQPKDFVLNVEQISDDRWRQTNPAYLSLLRVAKSIDYNPVNARLSGKNSFFIPIRPIVEYSYDTDERDLDVVFIGSMNESRRAAIDLLRERGIEIHCYFGLVGGDLQRVLSRANVCLNLHFYDSRLIEAHRVAMALESNCVLAHVGDRTNWEGYEFLIGAIPCFSSITDFADSFLAGAFSNENRTKSIEKQKTAWNTWDRVSKLHARGLFKPSSSSEEKKVKIFQPFYEDWHENFLIKTRDPDIQVCPLDTRAFPSNSWLEVSIFNRLMQQNPFPQYLGVWSWKIVRKSAISSDQLVEKVNKMRSGGADALIINPAQFANAFSANTFEHGEIVGHQSIASLASAVGIIKDKGDLCDPSLFAMCSYVVANQEFWLKYLSFVNSTILDVEEVCRSDGQLSGIWNGSGGYHRARDISMKPFFVERLLSFFLGTDHGLVIKIDAPSRDEIEQKFGRYGDLYYSLMDKKFSAFYSKDNQHLRTWDDARRDLIQDRFLFTSILHLDDPEVSHHA